jgi:hypothetical protein
MAKSKVYAVYVSIKVDIRATSPEKAEELAKQEITLTMPDLKGKAKEAFDYEIVSAEAEDV